MSVWGGLVNLFSKNKERDFDAKSLQGWPDSVFDLSTNGVPAITQKSATSISTYFGCLSIIANTFAYIPKGVRKKTNGGSEVDTDHDQHKLISKRPNPWQSAFSFWKEFEENKKNWGNGLALIKREPHRGRPIEYINLRPRYAKPAFSNGELFIEYKEKLPNGELIPNGVIPYRDVIHVPNFGAYYNDELGCIWGKSQISVAKTTLGIAKNSEVALESFLTNGGLFDKFLTTDLVLTKEQREVLKESIKGIRGAAKAGKMGVFDAGLEIKGLPMPFKDFAFLSANEFNVEEIARFFTFSALHKLGHLGKMSFNNIYQMSIEFVQTTMIPESKPIEEELAYKVLRPEEYEKTHYVNWEWKGLLQADPEKRKELLQMFWGMGVPANELMKIEDMNPIGPAGDQSYVQSAFMPADLSHDYWKSQISKNGKQDKPVLNGNGIH